MARFKTLTGETAEQIENVAAELAKGQEEAAKTKSQEEGELEFLKEFQTKWKKRKDSKPTDASMTKTELFKAVQEANKKLGTKKASPSLLKGLRDILDKDK